MIIKNLKSKESTISFIDGENVMKRNIINEQNVRSIRPGYGLHPKHYTKILGLTFGENLEKGTPLSFESIVM